MLLIAECLKLSLVKCDGGQKDEGHRADSMFTNIPSTSSSEEGGGGGGRSDKLRKAMKKKEKVFVWGGVGMRSEGR